ncbi:MULTISPECIES: hypothetical protein [unclassified Moorena]|nr:MULTISPECIES: hypothetical protein [unclassified Moorena]
MKRDKNQQENGWILTHLPHLHKSSPYRCNAPDLSVGSRQT